MKDWTFLYCVYFIMHFDPFCAFRVVVHNSVLPAETPCWLSTTSCGSVSVCLSVCLSVLGTSRSSVETSGRIELVSATESFFHVFCTALEGSWNFVL